MVMNRILRRTDFHEPISKADLPLCPPRRGAGRLIAFALALAPPGAFGRTGPQMPGRNAEELSNKFFRLSECANAFFERRLTLCRSRLTTRRRRRTANNQLRLDPQALGVAVPVRLMNVAADAAD